MLGGLGYLLYRLLILRIGRRGYLLLRRRSVLWLGCWRINGLGYILRLGCGLITRWRWVLRLGGHDNKCWLLWFCFGRLSNKYHSKSNYPDNATKCHFR